MTQQTHPHPHTHTQTVRGRNGKEIAAKERSGLQTRSKPETKCPNELETIDRRT